MMDSGSGQSCPSHQVNVSTNGAMPMCALALVSAQVKVPIAALVSVASRILHVDGVPPPASSSSLTPAPTLFPSIASPGAPNPTHQSLLCSLLPDLHTSALHLLSSLISSCQK